MNKSEGTPHKQQQQTEEQHENIVADNTIEKEIAKPVDVGEGKTHVIHDVDLNKVPAKPPDDLTDMSVSDEDAALKRIAGGNQSSSKERKDEEGEIQSVEMHQNKNAMQGSGENMKEKEDDNEETKTGDIQKEHSKLTTKKFELGGQT
ncbi:hypothetical protein K7X08_006186 [Anisodus acutangulus]|uniref:Uncharacterized protein n=1 Tax=Anisodus acutangulus TaxID=402998 RepID=A0A9Q1RRE5_9SOLA|nr:hypothetical protein K7X08_006186 [Anisodus acutangulus]